jgi:hypothetical protein
MILNIVALFLTIAITFMHSIFGFFSGVVNLCCTIFAAVVALAFFEPVSALINAQFGGYPGYTEAIVVCLLFVVALIALRMAADNGIRGNVRVPMYMDWGGAALFGFLNAQIIVGMLLISTFLLPLGGRVMGFERYERDPDRNHPDHPELANFQRNSLWLRPDDMTVWIVKTLTGGSMRGSTPLAAAYPDFADWAFFTTNTVQWESSPAVPRGSKRDGAKRGIAVISWWEQSEPVLGRYRKEVPSKDRPQPPMTQVTFKPAAGKKLLVVQMALKPDAADYERTRGIHLFRPTMLRVVGDSRGAPQHYPARIVSNVDSLIEGHARLADLDTNFSAEAGGGDVEAEVYFEVDEDFVPRFIEYRRAARASLAPRDVAQLESESGRRPREARDLRLGSAAAEVATREPTGRGVMRFVDAIEFPSGGVRGLPQELSLQRVRSAGGEVEGEALKSVRISGERSRLAPEFEAPSVKEFYQPEGYHICQIRMKPSKARTIVGQVFHFVARTVNQ